MTANLPDSAIEPYASLLRTGVHYGFAIVHPNPSLVPYTSDDTELKGLGEVLPMVMSVGWNPFYKNTRRTAVRLSFLLTICTAETDEAYEAGGAYSEAL